jgi:hypothetical protein
MNSPLGEYTYELLLDIVLIRLLIHFELALFRFVFDTMLHRF